MSQCILKINYQMQFIAHNQCKWGTQETRHHEQEPIIKIHDRNRPTRLHILELSDAQCKTTTLTKLKKKEKPSLKISGWNQKKWDLFKKEKYNKLKMEWV